MKAVLALFAIVLVLFPASAFASCPDILGPYYWSTSTWYVYSFGTSCAAGSGSVCSTTDGCSDPAIGYPNGYGTVSYYYEIGANDPIPNSNQWSAGLYADFSDPNNSASNYLTATVNVVHNRATTTYTIFSVNGSTGSLNCGPFQSYYYFTAVAGDTIYVTITGNNANPSNTVIRASAPFLENISN
jgi:hypothetical protein